MVNLSEFSKEITVESMKKAMIKTTNAVELSEKPGANKIEEYKKIFSNNEWIFEGKGM